MSRSPLWVVIYVLSAALIFFGWQWRLAATPVSGKPIPYWEQSDADWAHIDSLGCDYKKGHNDGMMHAASICVGLYGTTFASQREALAWAAMRMSQAQTFTGDCP